MLIEIDGHHIEIARPEKWVWYAQRYTIVDLAKYYVVVWRKPPIDTFKRYSIGNVPELLRSRGDAWAGLRRVSLRGMANPGRDDTK